MKRLTTKQLLPLVAGLLTACTGSEVLEEATDSRIIGFQAPVATRTVVNDATGMAQGGGYKVWGYHSKDGATKTVFPGTVITGDNNGTNWTYAGGNKYWEIGDYKFYAFYPKDFIKNIPNTGMLAFSFNVETQGVVGSNAKDLMVATSSRTYDGTNGGPVELRFQHLLSRVSVAIKKGNDWASATGNALTLKEVKMYGFASAGSYEASATTEFTSAIWAQKQLTYTTEENTFFKENWTKDANNGTNFGTDGILVYNEILAIPQTVKQAMEIKVSYSYYDSQQDETIEKISTVSLNSFTIREWEPGHSLRYVLTINPGGISFTGMDVPDWTSALTGGSIIVGN